MDTGATNAGWPVDVDATASYNGIPFVSVPQEDRGALALVNGIVYVPYSGYFGDCGMYHGWVVQLDGRRSNYSIASRPDLDHTTYGLLGAD